MGRSAGVVELASLGPATAVCDTGGYLFSFLSVTTTMLVTRALADSDETTAKRRARRNHVRVGRLRRGRGAAYDDGAERVVGARAHVRLCADRDPAGRGRVRANPCGWIRTLPDGESDQAWCLARRDVRTPLQAVVVACVANIVGDALLVTLWHGRGRRGVGDGGGAGALVWA